MDDGLLLQAVQGLDNKPYSTNGTVWNFLQDLKEEVSQELLAEGPLCHDDSKGSIEDEVSEAMALELEWAHRRQLEAELCAINHAQDRLLDGTYGTCEECGIKIGQARLAVNPSASLCLACQKNVDGEQRFRSL